MMAKTRTRTVTRGRPHQVYETAWGPPALCRLFRMPRRRRYPPGFQALLDQARRNEAGTSPRKHHLVPASYLRRWAENGQVRVTVVDERRSYLSSPETAARQTDFYRVQHPDINPAEVPPLLFETMLSRIEDSAKIVIDKLLDHFDPALVDPEQLALFTRHLAMSITRGKGLSR